MNRRITVAFLFFPLCCGFADQFGGSEKRKFMSWRLKQLLTDNHGLPMAEQKLVYKRTFGDWRGEYAQINEVLLFGVRI